MRSFDIETTGLSFTSDTITAASVYSLEENISQTFVFSKGDSKEEFLALLDSAPSLCAFNGARFDIPFLEISWNLSPHRTLQWRLKLFDLYELSVQLFGKGFSLNQLLKANQIPSKTASGTEAIQFYQARDWPSLASYCLQDTIKTYQVSSLPRVLLPLPASQGGPLWLFQDTPCPSLSSSGCHVYRRISWVPFPQDKHPSSQHDILEDP